MNISWIEAFGIMISGFLIVFVGLIILIVMVVLMGKFFKTAKKTPKQSDPPKAATPATSAKSAPARPMQVQNGVEEETVAVISAAVACMMQASAPHSAYAITGIKRGKEPRPVWGFAGMQQNTRPFCLCVQRGKKGSCGTGPHREGMLVEL